MGHAPNVVEGVNIFHDDDEFVAAKTSDTVTCAASAHQSAGNRNQHLVTGCVPKGVVNLLKVIQIYEHHRHHAAGALRPNKGLHKSV